MVASRDIAAEPKGRDRAPPGRGHEPNTALISPIAERLLDLQRLAGNRATAAAVRRGQIARQPITGQMRGEPQPPQGPSGYPATDYGRYAKELADYKERHLAWEVEQHESRFWRIVAYARREGYDVAASNLEWWLKGSGELKYLDPLWLREFDAVRDAERRNQRRFEASLVELSGELADGESRQFEDQWAALVEPDRNEELYYASGHSTLKSFGSFELRRQGRRVALNGHVRHLWWDDYDWHRRAKPTFIPGFGFVWDRQALFLEEHGSAASFSMKSEWNQSFSGWCRPKFWFSKTSASGTWEGPRSTDRHTTEMR